jgi:hypothetical protein
MKRTLDYTKEQYRGTLKQIMKVRGLRTISIANYYKWLAANGKATEQPNVYSLKLDIQDGYINAHGYDGRKIEDATADDYQVAYNAVNDMLANEQNIPYRIRRNIFVKVSR